MDAADLFGGNRGIWQICYRHAANEAICFHLLDLFYLLVGSIICWFFIWEPGSFIGLYRFGPGKQC